MVRVERNSYITLLNAAMHASLAHYLVKYTPSDESDLESVNAAHEFINRRNPPLWVEKVAPKNSPTLSALHRTRNVRQIIPFELSFRTFTYLAAMKDPMDDIANHLGVVFQHVEFDDDNLSGYNAELSYKSKIHDRGIIRFTKFDGHEGVHSYQFRSHRWEFLGRTGLEVLKSLGFRVGQFGAYRI